VPSVRNVSRSCGPDQRLEALLGALEGVHWVMASLLYSAGLRLLECLRLRVKDIDVASHQILLREGKGNKDRRTMLPAAVQEPLTAHLEHVRQRHQHDVAHGFGRVYVPNALQRKYPPANSEWGWQWVFPSSQISLDPRSGEHRGAQATSSARIGAPTSCQRCRAQHRADQAGQLPHATPFVRHTSSGRWLRYPHRQEFLGHWDVKTTIIYTHVLNRGGQGVYSPMDRL
jgi:integrase